MSNQTNLQRIYLFLHLAIALVISGCGGGSSSEPPISGGLTTSNELTNNSNSNTTDSNTAENPIVQQNSNVQTYQDANLQLNYPEGWILNTENNSITAQFLEPTLNEQQGQNNCVLQSLFSPESSLMDGVNVYLATFDDNPPPQISFVNINGTEMARIDGRISIFGNTADSNVQLAAKNQTVHSLLCVGISRLDIELIFNSMNIR